MSKTTVKKALAEFGEEELRGLILDLYAKSKEAKTLLDFYAVPDLDAKRAGAEADARKEITRRKRRRPAPRMSAIRAIVKKFMLFEPDAESVTRLRIRIIEMIASIGASDWFPDMFYIHVENFVRETVDHIILSRSDVEYHLSTLARIGESIRRIGTFTNPLQRAITAPLAREAE